MKHAKITAVAGIVLALWLNGVSSAQEVPPASQPGEKPVDAPPSLDDLLGVGEEKKEGAEKAEDDAAARDNQEELQRQLNEAEVANAFEDAIQKMSLSASMLDNQFDTGLGTQRLQEDIIAKLAQLIDQAKKSKSMSKSSSSSSRSQPNQQKDQANRSPSQKQDGKSAQQSQANQRNNNPSDSQAGDPPELQQGDVNTVIDETRSEWGNLPARVREMLMQGRKEKFSSLYQQLTQEYYKRLAEENAP